MTACKWTSVPFVLLLLTQSFSDGYILTLKSSVGRSAASEKTSMLVMPIRCATLPNSNKEFQEPSPTATGSQGEWSDWENDAHVDDEYTDDDDDGSSYSGSGLLEMLKSATDSSFQINSRLQIPLPTVISSDIVLATASVNSTISPIRGADYWEGWSEEPPYFDEYDVQDDEGNWGRSDETIAGGLISPALGDSSDLWTRATPSDDTIRVIGVTAPIVSSSASIQSANQPIHPSDVTDILSYLQKLEARIDARLDLITSSITPSVASTSAPVAASSTSVVRLQLPAPLIVVLYMVLFSTIQAVVNGFFQRW